MSASGFKKVDVLHGGANCIERSGSSRAYHQRLLGLNMCTRSSFSGLISAQKLQDAASWGIAGVGLYVVQYGNALPPDEKPHRAFFIYVRDDTFANGLPDKLHLQFLDSYDYPSRYGRGGYNRHMKPAIRIRNWRKGPQWFEINRALAIKIKSDTKYYNLFKKYCTEHCYPDEHYMPTFVHMFYEELNADRTVTYVDWSIVGPHPASFEGRDITKRFLESLRKNGMSCLYNKGTTDVCYLFARKFGPSSLEPLLEISSKVFEY
ncbi:hypothetical protein L1887_24464 [Cichorium endivia]|nr:hypothetical protein L1887_24464 [Cichorium endivia]